MVRTWIRVGQTVSCLVVAACTVTCWATGGWVKGAQAEAVKQRYFVVVRGVDEAETVKSGMVDEARKIFTAELARHPELTLSSPPGTKLDAAAAVSDLDAYKAALRANKLKALELTLRILEVTRGLEPPPAGKPFRVLKRGVRLAVFGTTLPDKVMAIGGDGDSTIAAEIRKTENEEEEGKKLLAEAMKAAVTQAVDLTVAKLKLPPPKDATRPKKK